MLRKNSTRIHIIDDCYIKLSGLLILRLMLSLLNDCEEPHLMFCRINFSFAVRDSFVNVGPLKDFSHSLRLNADPSATGIAKQSNYELRVIPYPKKTLLFLLPLFDALHLSCNEFCSLGIFSVFLAAGMERMVLFVFFNNQFALN
ncbi:unnamed protein product [Spirodela intermedia]|uniref:Uncharacterized protein n=1 Tax=Spirodela intermedia TaxID=51605 RepID=A0A7I8IF81_SPIIN|nr:unnamed protein product [Spirodela intermedia]CAA6656271.1 unnamed protein product [Spirodela intermedia]